MTEPKPNQGMRQPQLAGVKSDLRRAGIAQGVICRHRTRWRKGPAHPARCGTCHPPAEPAGAEWLPDEQPAG